MDYNYNEIIKKYITNVFSKIYLIDIINDKVLEYDYNCQLLNTLSFYDYVESTKSVIHSEDVNGYFDAISLKKLEELNSNSIYKYRKKVANNYNKYVSIIKLINNNRNNKYVLILESEASEEKNIGSESKDSFNKLLQITDRVSDVILKVFNTIDTINGNSDISQVMHSNNYINSLLRNLIKDIPELNKGLESQIISEVNKNKQSLMIIDDDLMTRNLIKKCFSSDYEIIMATNGQEALDILENNKKKNNLETRDNIVGIFLDLAMPVLDGFAVLEYLKANNILNQLPVIIISASEEKATRQRVYQYGIADMIEKPFNLEIIKYRTNNLINLYSTSNSLNELIIRKHDDLSDFVELIINSYLSDNARSINGIKKVINILLNNYVSNNKQYNITLEQIDKIVEASAYYDLGVYFIPRIITTNTKEYYNHPLIGSMVISKVLSSKINSNVQNYASEISKYHHENYDGSGFPNKVRNDNIPLYVQFVSLAIEYTSLVLNNVSINDIYNIIINQSNIKYNPAIIECFKNVVKELSTLTI